MHIIAPAADPPQGTQWLNPWPTRAARAPASLASLYLVSGLWARAFGSLPLSRSGGDVLSFG